MTKKNWFFRFYDPLPPIGKAAVMVFGGVVVYTGYNLIKDHFDRAGSRKSVNEFGGELDELANKGVLPSYTNAQYAAWANEIQRSFTGCDPLNTSAFTMIAILKSMRNNADFAKLVTSYGIRTYDDCLFGRVSGDLYTAVDSELNFLDKGSLNKVLRDRGITYRF